MSEEKFRTPSEVLIDALEEVEQAELVVIITQKSASVKWNSAMSTREPDITDVQLLLQRVQTMLTLDSLGILRSNS